VSERFADPQAYTPRHLAEKILTSKSAIAGERKQVTVLFTDVSGFTAMSERLDPEDVHGIMDRMFEVILAAVHRHEGTVNQFLGDGCMALFGAPIAHEDHAHRALRAALEIQRNLGPLRADVARAHGVELRLRVGINTGPVVVGAIGRDLRMDYTAVGDTTNLAARLLNIAAPGQIVVSEHTRVLTEGYFVFEPLGEFAVKGKSAPVRATAVLDERRGRTRLEVSRERGLTPLTGRSAERRGLLAAFERAAEGEGAVVWLTGEPGVGKSRLLYEFLRSVDQTGVLELEANCPSYGRSIPYVAILMLVRTLARIEETSPPEVVEERLGELLQRLGIDDDEATALLGHFLGLAVRSDVLVRLQGPELKQRTFHLLTAIILGASERRPCVVVVENVQWADDSSLEFLRQLAGAARGHRVLLLMSSRPEFAPPWRDEACTDTITVGGLARADVERMIGMLLDASAVAPSLVEMLLDKSGGNPLYLEEILRQLQETGRLRVEDGHARLEAEGIAVPETIHDIIAARIDRLEEPLKQTLQPAAVVGRQFAVPLVSRVLHADGELVPRLASLHALDFVFPSAHEPELAYTFKHALTQEVVYAGLLERRRRTYHAEIAAALEEMNADRLEDVAELLAYHYGRSGDDARAVDYAIRAGEKAQKRWANTEALAHFDAALKRLDAMEDTEPNRRRRIDAVIKQSEIKFALGRHAEQVQALEGIRLLVEESADPPRRAAWYYWAGFLHSLTGAHPSVSLPYCQKALEIADKSGLDDLRAFADCALAHVYIYAGDFAKALEAGEQALALFEARGNLWWACRALFALSPAANATGEWRRSFAYCTKMLAYGEETNDLRLRISAWWRTGTAYTQAGDAVQGLRHCEQASALSPGPFDAAMTKVVRGHALLKLGDAKKAVAELDEAVTWFERARLPYTWAAAALRLAEACLAGAERSRARTIAERALATARECGARYLEAMAARVLGESLQVEQPAAAAKHLATAATIFGETGARPELSRALVAQAELRLALGDRRQARALLERALALAEACGSFDQPGQIRTLIASVAAS
jgi:class 3 adenylate cyclase/tetratricopeptide (TPR) repeat protein